MPKAAARQPPRPVRPRPRAEDLIDANDSDGEDAPMDDTERDSAGEDEIIGPSADEDGSDSDNGDDAGSATSDQSSPFSAEASDDEPMTSDAEHDDAAEQMKAVSFGTLVRANDSLARKRKRDADSTPKQNTSENKLEAVRARLRDLKRARLEGGPDASTTKSGTKSTRKTTEDKAKSRKRARSSSDSDDQGGSDSSSSDSDSDSATDDGKPRSRSSKHAPASQSSRYQVTRKRTVIETPRSTARDPRFGSGPGSALARDRTSRAYAFLAGYEASEMAQLRDAIKRTRDPSSSEAATLRRKLVSMENRARASAERERRQGVLREHRRAQKEAVAMVKTPFYLKKAEQKRLALVERYEGMKGKERERAVERRRKKEAQREKKSMPAPRRITG